jgi:hypothetical protein
MRIGVAAILGIWIAAAAPLSANEALRPKLAELSKNVAKFLKGRDEDTLSVGAFTGPNRSRCSAGPGIEKILIEELQKCGLRVKSGAKLEIKGDYLDVTDKDSQLLSLRIDASIRDRQGDTVFAFKAMIDDRNVLAQILGMNKPDLGAGLTPEKESELLRTRLENPSVGLVGTRVQADRQSPYGLEILVRAGDRYQPRKATDADGLAFVQLGRGEVFAIKLLNDSDCDAAVELSLDGLSMFAFSDNKNYRHVIIPRKSSAVIQGWHRTNQLSSTFVITEYVKSAAAELLANPDQVGTITATFAAAWDPKDGPPKDESSKFRDPFNPAVGRGEPVKTPYKEVTREHGRVRDVISVRYRKPPR